MVDPILGFTSTALFRKVFSKERCESAGLPFDQVSSFVEDLCTVTDACCFIRQGMMSHYINTSYTKKNGLDSDHNAKLASMRQEMEDYISTQSVQRCLEGDILDDFKKKVVADFEEKREACFKKHADETKKIEQEATTQISLMLQRASMSEWEFSLPSVATTPGAEGGASSTPSATTSEAAVPAPPAPIIKKVRLNFNELRVLLSDETMLPMIRSPPFHILAKMYGLYMITVPILRDAYIAQLRSFKKAKREADQNKKGGEVAKATRNTKMLQEAKKLTKHMENLIFAWTALKYIRVVLAPVSLTHYRWILTKPWEKMTKGGGGDSGVSIEEAERLKAIILSGGLLIDQMDRSVDFGPPAGFTKDGPILGDVWFAVVLLLKCPWIAMNKEFQSMSDGFRNKSLAHDHMVASLERIEDRIIDDFPAKRVQIVDNAVQRPEKEESEQFPNEPKPEAPTIEMSSDGITDNFTGSSSSAPAKGE
jgi:hypothetical protein